MTVGVVGGMGPLATAAFLQTLTMQTEARRDQDHLHVIIESDPTIPDRTEFLVGQGPDPRPAIIHVAKRLQEAGGDLLVIPCNTANVWAAEIEAAIDVPLVPWIATAVETAAASRPETVGILGTTGTLLAGGYQAAFDSLGIRTLQPRDETQDDVMDAIYGVGGVKASGALADDNRQRLVAAAGSLADSGADLLLLACTELPLAMPADDPDWPVPVVDPAVEVARRIITAAGFRVRDDRARKALAPRAARVAV
jgi:aspartate racemase